MHFTTPTYNIMVLGAESTTPLCSALILKLLYKSWIEKYILLNIFLYLCNILQCSY